MVKVGAKAGGRTAGDYAIGRRRALRELDKILEIEGNLNKLSVAFQKRFDKNPFEFFTKLVMPLLPDVEDSRGEGGVGQTTLTPDQVVLEMDMRTCTFNRNGISETNVRPRIKLREGS